MLDQAVTYQDKALLEKVVKARLLEGWEFYDQFRKAASFPFAPVVAFLLKQELIVSSEALEGLSLMREVAEGRRDSDLFEEQRPEFQKVETLILLYLFHRLFSLFQKRELSWEEARGAYIQAKIALEGRVFVSDEDLASIEEVKRWVEVDLLLYNEGLACQFRGG